MNNYQFPVMKEIADEVEADLKLVDRDENSNCSNWLVTTTHDFLLIYGSNERMLPAGSQFKYNGLLDETEDEVVGRLVGRGIVGACDINRDDFERMLEEPEYNED